MGVHVEEVVAAAAAIGHDGAGFEDEVGERPATKDGEWIDRLDHQILEALPLHRRPEAAVVDGRPHRALGIAHDVAAIGLDRRRLDLVKFTVAAVLEHAEVRGAVGVPSQFKCQQAIRRRNLDDRLGRLAVGQDDRGDPTVAQVEPFRLGSRLGTLTHAGLLG